MKLRLAARFLRGAGYRFVHGNFYDSVFAVLNQMEPMEKKEMRDLIEWVLSYELEEGGAPAHAQKQKPLTKKRAVGAFPAPCLISEESSL